MIWILLASKVMAFEVIYNEFDNLNVWEKRSISFYYDHEGAPESISEADAIDAIVASATAWSLVPGTDIELVYEDRIEPEATDRDDNFNIIFWDQAWENQDSDILALTGLWANEAGFVRGFDMRLREDKPWSIGSVDDAFDFQNAMAHELGHALGLAHPGVEDATMHSVTEFGELSKRDLHWDDEEAIRYLYAPTRAKSVFGCTTTSRPMSTLYWVPALLLVALRMRDRSPSPNRLHSCIARPYRGDAKAT